MTKNNRVALYGAVTAAPSSSPKFSSKQILRQYIKRILIRLEKPQVINYRNHINVNAYNLGDNAISVASSQQIKSITQEIDIDMVDWGALEASGAQTPIVFAGSGYYFIETSKNPAQRVSHDTHFIQKHGVSCSHFGVGVNFVGKNARLALEDITSTGQKILTDNLAMAKMISVRDEVSKAILQPLTDTPISVTGDPALFIKPDYTEIKEPRRSAAPLTIGINIPFHGPAASARISNDLRAYISFFQTLQNDTGCRFIQTVHFHSEVFIGKILQDHGIRLTQAIGDVQTLLSAYQEMDLHIGGMLHSCILSASVGTPCIGLAYDIKHQGFFDLLGLPDLCIPAEPFDPERLGAACEYVLSQTDKIRAHIDARRDELEVESNRFLAKTLQSLLS